MLRLSAPRLSYHEGTYCESIKKIQNFELINSKHLRVQKHLCGLVSDKLFSTLQLLYYRQNVASLFLR